MGWSRSGNTRQKYQHYYADDSFDAVLTCMDGLTPAGMVQGSNKKKKDLLKPKQCPNCDESNKPESRFCSKCKFVLSFDAFNETMEESGKTKGELEDIKKKVDVLYRVIKSSQQLVEFHEDDKRMILLNNDMHKAAKEIQKDEEYEDKLEQEAAEIVDPDMEAEFMVGGQ